MLGCDNAVIESVSWEEASEELAVVVHVRPKARRARRCGICGKRRPGYDQGSRRRRWRALDLGTVTAWLEADCPRVSCPQHGIVVAAVPWARHGAGHTRFFDDQVAWLAAACSKTTVTELLRVSWRTVGNIVERVCASQLAVTDPLDGLRRIGIDEISYKKGHKYLVVVVDHATGRLVWAAPGRDTATVTRFFDALGPERAARLTHVSADGAGWIAAAVAVSAPGAVLCCDPFHVVSWATGALDEVRREAWRQARAAGQATIVREGPRTKKISRGSARDLKNARYALWKNPENLTTSQQAKLAWIEKTSPYLYRAWLLKEGLRLPFQLKGQEGKDAIDAWLKWAARCRIPEFIELGRKIRRHLPAIHATLDHGLSNGLVESVNTKIRVITRMAFGFRNPRALIALAMLALGGLRPPLPGR
jgi:transposase